ncbi:MAG: thiamine pyrophosphate-dependent dehydrogenase E1 component subunit alpha [Gemmatimonadota bacterium]|jgi:pyruvate dehydrogenase E1 component alpha subunit/2-oxoisovalerate dehydrogenase E1 component alpha subunit
MADPLASGLDREQLLEIHDALERARATEERLELLHRQGQIGGGVYRGLGQEAGAVGTAYALRRRTDGTGDLLAQTIRETGALLLFGGTPLEYFQQYTARGTGPTAGKEANVHFTDFQRGFIGPVSPLGTMVEVMAGITLSFRMRGEDRVGAVFYGDGATSTGAWHEGLHFAAVQRCPMILLVEANQWAFSTPTRKQTRVGSFVEKAPAYGVTGVSVDGTDVLAVHDAVGEAAARARAGEGTQLVELRYYRRLGHAQHDPQDYVDPGELEEWAARDPLERYRRRVIEEGWADEGELHARRERIHDEVHAAAEQAVADPLPVPADALSGVYSDVAIPAPWTRRDPVEPGGP